MIIYFIFWQLLWISSHSFGFLGRIASGRTTSERTRECMEMKWHFGKGGNMQELGIIGIIFRILFIIFDI